MNSSRKRVARSLKSYGRDHRRPARENELPPGNRMIPKSHLAFEYAKRSDPIIRSVASLSIGQWKPRKRTIAPGDAGAISQSEKL